MVRLLNDCVCLGLMQLTADGKISQDEGLSGRLLKHPYVTSSVVGRYLVVIEMESLEKIT
jgi:hypothetical protein